MLNISNQDICLQVPDTGYTSSGASDSRISILFHGDIFAHFERLSERDREKDTEKQNFHCQAHCSLGQKAGFDSGPSQTQDLHGGFLQHQH